MLSKKSSLFNSVIIIVLQKCQQQYLHMIALYHTCIDSNTVLLFFYRILLIKKDFTVLLFTKLIRFIIIKDIFTCIINPKHLIPDINSSYYNEDNASNHKDHVQVEVSSVVVADTIVEPRAVVVHTKDTTITNRTMMCPWWLW